MKKYTSGTGVNLRLGVASVVAVLAVLLACPTVERDEPDDDDTTDDELTDDDAIDDDDSAATMCPDGVLTPPLDDVEEYAALLGFCEAGCSVIDGNLGIPGEEDDDEGWGDLLERLDCLTAIEGSLTVRDVPADQILMLPALEYVGEFLEVSDLDDRVSSISFPVLHSVGRSVRISDSALNSISMPSLSYAEQIRLSSAELMVAEFPALERLGTKGAGNDGLLISATALDLEMPALREVWGDVYIGASPLTTFSLPSLVEIEGGLFIASNSSLPSLTTIGVSASLDPGIGLQAAASLESGGEVLDLPQLVTIEGDVVFYHMLEPAGWLVIAPQMTTVGGNLLVGPHSGLSALSLEALDTVTGTMDVGTNELLETLELPLLSSVGGDFLIYDNPVLPTSQAEALLDQVGEANIGGEVVVEGNGLD